jgi:glycosyltransferase involved in cell wall biosynthesis
MATNRIILIRNANHYDFGGGERFPVFTAEILAQQGYSPVIVSRSSKLRQFAETHHLTTVKGPWWSRQNWSGRAALLFPLYVCWQVILFFWYFGLFVKYRPISVHIQSKDDFIAATLAARGIGARVIWTDHADLKHVWKNLSIWYKNPVGKLVYLCARFAHAITLVSNSELELVTVNLPPHTRLTGKLQVIYNGILDLSSKYPRVASEDSFTFCVASRLVTDKGIREVIGAFKGIAATHPNSRLLLMGDGPEATIFHKEAKDTAGIVFLGHQKDPLRVMAQADVFVHPTYHEGFSVALVEASMIGLPIIATAVGGNREIITPEETGLLVPAKDTDALKEAMNRLLQDKHLRTSLGRNARTQYVNKFQFDHIVSNSFIPLYLGDKQ